MMRVLFVATGIRSLKESRQRKLCVTPYNELKKQAKNKIDHASSPRRQE
jgi:hypothetical protein